MKKMKKGGRADEEQEERTHEHDESPNVRRGHSLLIMI